MRRCWKLSPSSIPRLFLQGSSSATRPFTGAGVGTRTLTAYRQTTLVAHASISSQIDQTLDRQLYFATQITFNREHTNVFADALRSEEHTSELQSLMRISYAVFSFKQ